jgi:hypothetical protein
MEPWRRNLYVLWTIELAAFAGLSLILERLAAFRPVHGVVSRHPGLGHARRPLRPEADGRPGAARQRGGVRRHGHGELGGGAVRVAPGARRGVGLPRRRHGAGRDDRPGQPPRLRAWPAAIGHSGRRADRAALRRCARRPDRLPGHLSAHRRDLRRRRHRRRAHPARAARSEPRAAASVLLWPTCAWSGAKRASGGRC